MLVWRFKSGSDVETIDKWVWEKMSLSCHGVIAWPGGTARKYGTHEVVWLGMIWNMETVKYV